MSDQDKTTGRPCYSLTTINVQGDDQEAFEVYADQSREQTVGFVFDERYARLIVRAVNHFEEMRERIGLMLLDVEGAASRIADGDLSGVADGLADSGAEARALLARIEEED